MSFTPPSPSPCSGPPPCSPCTSLQASPGTGRDARPDAGQPAHLQQRPPETTILGHAGRTPPEQTGCRPVAMAPKPGDRRIRRPATRGGYSLRSVDRVLSAVREALAMAGSMGWEILWALILGFFLSGAVESVVRKETMSRWIGDDRPKSLAVATGLGRRPARAATPRWRWRGRCSARGRTSRRRWPSRSPPRTWSSRWGSSSRF